MSCRTHTVALCCALLCLLHVGAATAQPIETFAGGGPDQLPATSANLDSPPGVAVDASGNLFIAARHQNRVFKVDLAGTLTVVAGNGTPGFSGDGGPATSARLNFPFEVAVDPADNLLIADLGNQRIRKVDPTGIITTVAGDGTSSFSGDSGPATSASLANPYGIAADSSGNFFIADSGNNRIRKVELATGIITTIAGNGISGFSGDGGPATSASLGQPRRVAVDAAGNLFIADRGNQRIRKVDPITGIITTVAGNGTRGFSGDGGPATGASLADPYGIAVGSSGNLFIADLYNQRIRKVDPAGIITTVAGNGTSGFSGDGGPATSASLSFPLGVAVDSSGNLFIADLANHRIRKVDPAATITTVAGNGTFGFSGDGGAATHASLKAPVGVAVDAAGNVSIVDYANQRIRRVDPATGLITTVAGNGSLGFSGDGGPATSASLANPAGVAVDANDNLFIADSANHRIRKVDPAGTITTVAGKGSWGFSGDGGPATSARLSTPSGVGVDAAGNLFIADFGNQRIRKVDPSGIITTVAGNGTRGFSGDGGPATSASLALPHGVAVDAAGNLFIADQGNQRIRKVDPAGIITTVAGNGTRGFSGDGGPATSASLAIPRRVAVDAAGNLFIADQVNQRIRKVDAAGIITTVAGNGTRGFSGDGGSATSASLANPMGVAVDASDNLYIADSGNSRIRRVGLAAPVADAGPDQSIRAGATVFLDGTASFDDNTATALLLYSWSFSSLPAGSTATLTDAATATPSFVADVDDTYVVRLTVTDEDGLASAPDEVVVSADNLPPTAAAGSDQLVVTGTTVFLDGTASTDPDADALTYDWTLTTRPEGSTASLDGGDGAFPSFVADLGGLYGVTLLVSDPYGPGSPDTVQITATTAEEFAAVQIVSAGEAVAALQLTEVTTQGNQTALLNFLSQATLALQADDLPTAVDKLEKSLDRTNGCALRGVADGNGPGRDWITYCPAQVEVYDLLSDALAGLSP